MGSLKKDMQKEIKKYQDRIFYFDPQDKAIKKADWVHCLADYNHYELEAHHVIPYTQWEKNEKNIQSKYENALILLPKVMHQHLENPIYQLTKQEFKEVYGIDPDRILFNVNSKNPRTATPFLAELSVNYIPCASEMLAPGISFECQDLFTEDELKCFDSLFEVA